MKYLYEVLAIVIGITISFMVDEWREFRQDNERRDTYLKSMYYDLKQDSLYFSIWGNRLDSGFVLGQELWNVTFEGESLSDSILFIQNSMFVNRFPAFQYSGFTYDELKNSGNFRLVKEDSLRLMIREYYEYDLFQVWTDQIPTRLHAVHDMIVETLPMDLLFTIESFDTTSYVAKMEHNPQYTTDFIVALRNHSQFKDKYKNSLRTIYVLSELYDEKLKDAIRLKNRIKEFLGNDFKETQYVSGSELVAQ